MCKLAIVLLTNKYKSISVRYTVLKSINIATEKWRLATTHKNGATPKSQKGRDV